MSQLSSRETSDMDIDDESFSQINQHAKPSIACSQSFLNSDSDTASFKSVNEFIEDDKDSQGYCTDEERYPYKELFEDAQEVSSSVNKSKAHQEEETSMEDMSIDDESFLESKENVNPSKPIKTTPTVKKDYRCTKRLYKKQDNM